MSRIEQIAKDPAIQNVIAGLTKQIAELVELTIAVQQIPAPTFQEAKRATYVEKCFSSLGLRHVQQDQLHNVSACLSGTEPNLSTPLIISAHSDTVFPIKTELATRRDGHLLYGPGIADNSAGVAGIITLAKLLTKYKLRPRSDIWFVANVGEEGLGNLRGMRAVVERFGKNGQYIVVEGGSFGQLIYKAIGVQRFRIVINTPGGHSWGNFGQPSAIHELGKLIAEISKLRVPTRPKTTFNIGVIQGGTTVNSIASSASLLLDLRSEQSAILDNLVLKAKNLVDARRMMATRRNKNVVYHMEQVGYRPAGQIAHDHPLVNLAEDSLKQVGCHHVTNTIGSTDANIPLSQNIPCVCVGLATSGNSHRLDEYIDLKHLQSGMKQLLLLTLAASEYC